MQSRHKVSSKVSLKASRIGYPIRSIRSIKRSALKTILPPKASMVDVQDRVRVERDADAPPVGTYARGPRKPGTQSKSFRYVPNKEGYPR